MLMLCSNLMVEREEDKAVLRRIIVACINPLQVKLQVCCIFNFILKIRLEYLSFT